MTLLNNNRSKAYALLLINTALWGFAAPIAKEAYKAVSPFQFLFGRYLLASLIFLPIYLLFFYHPFSSRKTDFKLYLPLALLSTPLCLLPL